MTNIRNATAKAGILAGLGVILAGCETEVTVRGPAVYVPPPPPPAVVVEAPAPPPAVVVEAEPAPPGAIVITAETDFEAPLTPYGRWEVVDGVNCWFPTQVEVDWRPYTVGHWERTDAGWYWHSDEPWGWATCHYGRWAYREGRGWYWAPGVHWGPAWVAWRSGGGYSGWAPLPPEARFEAGVGVRFDVNLIPPRSFCFVREEHFTEPVRPTTVIVKNKTNINKTVNITKITVVNKTIINEGPPPERIERATGHPVQVVRATELRQKVETRVAVKPQPHPVARESRPEARAAAATERGTEKPKPETATREEQRPVEKPKPVVAAHPEQQRPVEKPKPVVAARPEEKRQVEKPKAPGEERKVEGRPEQPRKPEPGAKQTAKKPAQKPPPKKKPAENEKDKEHPENGQPQQKPQPQPQ